MPNGSIQTVMVFNASDDTVEMLKALLTHNGYRAVDGEVDRVKSGETNFIELIEKYEPAAIIWDITPPYDKNWNFFQLVRAARPLEGCAIVLTTTHKQHLDALIGRDSGAIEIVGKPYDLNIIVDAVSRSIGGKETAGPRALWQNRSN
jgi:DNA-binding response OmpR family regulator